MIVVCLFAQLPLLGGAATVSRSVLLSGKFLNTAEEVLRTRNAAVRVTQMQWMGVLIVCCDQEVISDVSSCEGESLCGEFTFRWAID